MKQVYAAYSTLVTDYVFHRNNSVSNLGTVHVFLIEYAVDDV